MGICKEREKMMGKLSEQVANIHSQGQTKTLKVAEPLIKKIKEIDIKNK